MQRAFAKRRTFTDGRAGDSNPNGIQPEENEQPKESTLLSFCAFNQKEAVSQKKPLGEYKILHDKYFKLQAEMELIRQKLKNVGFELE